MAGFNKFKAGSVIYNYRVDAQKWQRFKNLAEARNVPLSTLLDAAVDEFLAQNAPEKAEER